MSFGKTVALGEVKAMPGVIAFGVDTKTPVAFPYNASKYADPPLVLPFASLAVLGVIMNVALFFYILIYRLYNKFISSRFIMHLCVTNVIGLLFLMPMFLYTLWTGENLWRNNNVMCRVQVYKQNKLLWWPQSLGCNE